MIPLIEIAQFVLDVLAKCCKPAQQIIDSLNPTKMDMLHAAVGISGEAGELERAVWAVRSWRHYNVGDRLDSPFNPTKEGEWGSYWNPPYGAHVDISNVHEEMGDHQFYFNLLLRELPEGVENISRNNAPRIPELWDHTKPPHELVGVVSSRALLCDLVSIHSILAADILDLVKKHVIYNKPFDTKKEGEEQTLLEKLLDKLAEDHWVQDQMAAVTGTTIERLQRENEQKLSKGEKARYKEGYSDQAAQERADKEEDDHEVNEVSKVTKTV